MSSQPVLLIRADANAQIGTGHVMRCLALAQAWQRCGGQVAVAMAPVARMLKARLDTEGMKLLQLEASSGSSEDARQTELLAHALDVAWIVLDGYQFGDDYEKVFKGSASLLLSIDDYGHASHRWADVILNQNSYATDSMYPDRKPDAQLLLGPANALLRREFLTWCGWRREIQPMAQRVLVSLGGSDPENVTLKAIEALQSVDARSMEAKVVIGPSNPHRDCLEDAVRRASLPIHLLNNVDNMPELMAWADIAICAGGSTCWELAFMGLPSLTIVLAENQRRNAQDLDERAISCHLGWWSEVDAARIAAALEKLIRDKMRRAEMSSRGQRLVDGAGANRVVEICKHISEAKTASCSSGKQLQASKASELIRGSAGGGKRDD